MATSSEVLQKLIAAAYKGPVFGAGVSFGADAAARLLLIQKQIAAIAAISSGQLYACIERGMPEYNSHDVKRILGEIAPKAISFCPALAAGELATDADTKALAATASAIGTMYFADQTMDRGDEAMVLAIEQLCGHQPKVPATLARVVAARLAAIQDIQRHIRSFALPEDAPYVLNCYDQQVLYNEIGLHKMSVRYKALPKKDQHAFLAEHAPMAAWYMVSDAGLPSVASSLYAIYRHHDRQLPTLAEVHTDKKMKQFLQMCNVVARIGDEVGDWPVDAGQHKEWGVFSINPFNQYHPHFVATLCDLAGLTNPERIAWLQKAFKDFHSSDAARQTYTQQIPEVFFTHARESFLALSPAFVHKYKRYITLCMRVLEIAQVNMAGDRALAGQS
jgi:hypothetical protein